MTHSSSDEVIERDLSEWEGNVLNLRRKDELQKGDFDSTLLPIV